MKKIVGLLLTCFLLIFTPTVAAQSMMQGEYVVVPANQVIDENYFATGDSVTMSGTVNGDAYIAGGTVYVDGTINGDLLVAGGTININGLVTGDIRGAGGQVTISGQVDGNLTLAGGNINISENAKIAKGLVGAGGQMNIMAPLGKGIVVGAGQLTLNNVVNGNVVAGVGNIVLTPNARVNGNLTYYSEKQTSFPQGAVVTGRTDFKQQETYNPKEDNQKVKEAAVKGAIAASVMFIIYSFIVSLITGATLLKLAPHFMQLSADTIKQTPWMSMGIGLLTLIVTPMIAFMLFITILGIPFAFFLMMMYIVMLCLAKIFVALYAGERISTWFNWQKNRYVSFLIGLIAVTFITIIPIFGWIVQFIVTITGIGALLLTKKAVYESLRAKNLV